MRVRSAIDPVDPQASHASWMEGDPEAMRAAAGDGSYAGWYERPGRDVLEIWRIGVEEARAALEHGWS